MIRFILSLFGYVHVPREAVELSMFVEDYCALVADVLKSSEVVRIHKAAHAITEFLRSGRLISG